MTNINLSYTPEDLFREVVARGRGQGVTDQSAYDYLVEEVIEEHRKVGEIHTDDPTEDLETHLRGRWADYQAMQDEEAN